MNAFLAAAVPGNIVMSFSNAGVGVVTETLESGQRVLLCNVVPHKARGLNFPLEQIFPPVIPEEEDEDDDDLEFQLYLQACAELLMNGRGLE
jgi:hypothetical protein